MVSKNGIRTLPQYHPWNTLKTCEKILDELNADIVCFQEVKTTRHALERQAALPGHYDAFFSFPTAKTGYSGVGVFTNSDVAVPLKAEEGLSGRLQAKPPLSAAERISPSYPSVTDLDLVPDENGRTPVDLLELDLEGRALILDFGLFVLINLYCPNETSDARLPYKLNFQLLLAERVRKLTQEEGREVIVTGDINICAAPIDHVEGEMGNNAIDFWEHPARAWLRDWLDPRGPMVDVIRSCWPDRKDMFTCWNTKISARASNYGTRIDYFLLTKGLLPWFKLGDIQPSIKGSDHCPIYIDLHDEITTESGRKITLREAMHMTDVRREPPRLAAKHWPEYQGKQKLLSSFFGKGNKEEIITTSTIAIAKSPSPPELQVDCTARVLVKDTPPSTQTSSQPPPLSSPPPAEAFDSTNAFVGVIELVEESAETQQLKAEESAARAPSASSSKRRKLRADSNYPAQPKKKLKKVKSAQAKLSSFFVKPASTLRQQSDPAPSGEQRKTPLRDNDQSQSQSAETLIDLTGVDDLISAHPHSEPDTPPLEERLSPEEAKNQWTHLFARIEPPRCTVHREPAIMLTVNKPGPNKGKTFFMCSRPVGPGYDAGKSVRLREEVNPNYRCNFFKWSSEVKRESLRQAQKRTGDK